MTEDRGFDPEAMLRTLADHRVDYVLIGGVAATLHGSPHVTTDVDVTPDRDEANLERLAAALRTLSARVRVEGIPEGLPFDPTGAMLAHVSILELTTRFGDLDLTFEPVGTGSYSDLQERAAIISIRGIPVTVASLSDIIRSKEAAGREKDLATLPTLRRIVERLEREG